MIGISISLQTILLYFFHTKTKLLWNQLNEYKVYPSQMSTNTLKNIIKTY